MIELGPVRYGKSAIRLVKIVRGPAGNAVRDLTIDIALEGDFAASYTDGVNAGVVATDTMKNTTYAMAKDRLTGSIEAFGRVLASHFLGFDQVERAIVTIREHRWTPVPTAAGASKDAFLRDPSVTRLAVVTGSRHAFLVEAGIEDLTVMKTGKSSFAGFPRDEFTTLPETSDRIMATKVSARWRYVDATDDPDYDGLFAGVSETLLDAFAIHESPSVQATIWVLGKAVLDRHATIEEISFALPNLHHLLVDLAPFGMTNDNEVFVATREPYGLIEATITRAEVSARA